MGPWTTAVYDRLYHTADPVHDAAQRDADIAAFEKKCPTCDWCDGPITDEEFLQRIDHKGRTLHYHEECAEDWFKYNFKTIYLDDYTSSESEV
jgi:hypothetical protein